MIRTHQHHHNWHPHVPLSLSFSARSTDRHPSCQRCTRRHGAPTLFASLFSSSTPPSSCARPCTTTSHHTSARARRHHLGLGLMKNSCLFFLVLAGRLLGERGTKSARARHLPRSPTLRARRAARRATFSARHRAAYLSICRSHSRLLSLTTHLPSSISYSLRIPSRSRKPKDVSTLHPRNRSGSPRQSLWKETYGVAAARCGSGWVGGKVICACRAGLSVVGVRVGVGVSAGGRENARRSRSALNTA